MITILETPRGRMELSGSPEPRAVPGAEGNTVYRQDARAAVTTTVDIRGFREIHWPNREGESFTPASAAGALAELDRNEGGISLCWPATASMQGLGVSDDEGFYIFSAEPGDDGRVRFLTLDSAGPEGVRFVFTGSRVEWRLKRYPAEAALPAVSDAASPGTTLWQLGLIDPEGVSRVPGDRGFSILEEAADRIRNLAGEPSSGDIIHVFGYAHGHDRGYPDYRPAEALGGPEGLRRGISSLKSRGFEVSLYMNARLAERRVVESDAALGEAAMQGSAGLPVIETYRGRDFLVMNPDSAAWRDRLLLEAGLLASTGADWIQLDQVAGRGAPAGAGAPWGSGYRRIIKGIRNLGLRVWIQGVSDYYPADAFEATWRPVTILDDGTLRGGCPFGIPNAALLKNSGFSGTLIVPGMKIDSLETSGLEIIRDANSLANTLPLWDADWPGTHIHANNSRPAGENNGGSK